MTEILLDRIAIGKRLRAHNPQVVDRIAASFVETGQLQAIVVLPAKDGEPHPLVAGARRGGSEGLGSVGTRKGGFIEVQLDSDLRSDAHSWEEVTTFAKRL